VRKFDEAAEWRCDAEAYGDAENGECDFAETMLLFRDIVPVTAVCRTAFCGNNIKRRATRLAQSKGQKGDPLMKKMLIVLCCVTLLLCGVVEIKLTAQDAKTPPTSRWENTRTMEAKMRAAQEKDCTDAIRRLPGIANAQVFVNIRSSWDRNVWARTQTTATVVVETIEAKPMEATTIVTIGQMMATTFGIADADITIIDTKQSRAYNGAGTLQETADSRRQTAAEVGAKNLLPPPHVATLAQSESVDQEDIESRYKKVAILPPITGDRYSHVAHDSPSDDQVIRELNRVRPVGDSEAIIRNVKGITKELVADYVDPPRVLPLVGTVQLHHAHYKCTVIFDEIKQNGSGLPQVKKGDVTEVFYIDTDHFHRVDGGDEETPPSSALVDQDYIDLLKKRVEVAKEKVNLITVANERVRGTFASLEISEAELALAEAEYALKKAQREPGTVSPIASPPSATQLPALNRPLLFQGKTFEQWQELLQTELDPTIRAEAFRAFVMFGANGRGKEATEVIIEAVKGFDFSGLNMSAARDTAGRDPVEAMKKGAVDAFTSGSVHIPLEDSLPILMEQLVQGDKNEQSLTTRILFQLDRLPAMKEYVPMLYAKVMSLPLPTTEPEDERLPILLWTIARHDLMGEYAVRYVRETIQKNDAKRFQSYFFGFSPKFDEETKLLVNDYQSGSHSLTGMQQIIVGDWIAMQHSSGRDIEGFENPRLTPFGKSLLELLRSEGVASDNETIRTTSQNVVDALAKIEELE